LNDAFKGFFFFCVPCRRHSGQSQHTGSISSDFLGAATRMAQVVREKIRFAWGIKYLLNTFINVKRTLITDEVFFIKFEESLALF
jgi:hypothetical protein